MSTDTGLAPPSPWIARFAPLAPPGGTVLDVACGTGRHARFFAARGCTATAVDRDTSRLRPAGNLEIIEADLEDGTPWPLAGRRFDMVVVANYLHRPLFPALLAALAPGGVLVYETFAAGNEKYGRPRNPDFLLREGELLDICRGKLSVVAYESGRIERPAGPAIVQRIAAVDAAGDEPVSIPPPV